jgi:hypothetical protein
MQIMIYYLVFIRRGWKMSMLKEDQWHIRGILDIKRKKID